jgi:uncharacterized protein YkvS
MELQELVSIKSKFVAREVGDEMILVPLTNNVAQMSELFTLNETARFIWENVNENSTIQELAISMTDSFDIDIETAKNDISVFLNHLQTSFRL